MKFVCDRCGKRYATAEDPTPGKVYKLKCKACGNLIVVRAQAGTSTALPAVAPEAAPTHEIELTLDIEPGKAPAGPAPNTQAGGPAWLPPEVASAIDSAAPVPSGPPPGRDELSDLASVADEVMRTPGASAPYVDLFADSVTGETKVPKGAGRPPEEKREDPFAAAARASLPEGFLAGGAPIPLAPQAAASRASATPPPGFTRPAEVKPAAAKPAAVKPGGKKKGGPTVALIGGGLAVLLAITGYAVTSGTKKPAPPPAPVVAQRPTRPEPAPPPPVPVPVKVAEPAPPPEPAPEPKVEPKAEPKAEPKPAPKPAPVVEKRPEPRPAPRPAEKRPEPAKVATAAPTPPPPAPVPEEPKTETREVSLPDADVALTPEVVQRVISANRKAFSSCIASAGGSVTLDGRRVALRLTVSSNGAVTYPTLDDVTLNSTEMGQCLKSAARLMIFPKFKGDPYHVEVPLTLSAP